MFKTKSSKLSCAIALGLVVSILLAVAPMAAQARLAKKLTRLHIVANSDSFADQKLKLCVRDKILALTGTFDFGANRMDDSLLLALEAAAQSEVFLQGFDYAIKAEKARMFFETKQYDSFSLPAGYYDAVRITIGQGEGQNWWCVVFPPLCSGVCEADFAQIARENGLSDDEIAYISESGTQYVIRFKIVESLSRLFSKKN